MSVTFSAVHTGAAALVRGAASRMLRAHNARAPQLI